jgi:hypothetical protein
MPRASIALDQRDSGRRAQRVIRLAAQASTIGTNSDGYRLGGCWLFLRHRPLANGEPQPHREALVRTVYMLVAKAGGAIGIMSLKRIDDRFVLHALATNRLRASAPGDLRQSLEFPHQAPSDLRNALVT